jgi:hypothetical protein
MGAQGEEKTTSLGVNKECVTFSKELGVGIPFFKFCFSF